MKKHQQRWLAGILVGSALFGFSNMLGPDRALAALSLPSDGSVPKSALQISEERNANVKANREAEPGNDRGIDLTQEDKQEPEVDDLRDNNNQTTEPGEIEPGDDRVDEQKQEDKGAPEVNDNGGGQGGDDKQLDNYGGQVINAQQEDKQQPKANDNKGGHGADDGPAHDTHDDHGGHGGDDHKHGTGK